MADTSYKWMTQQPHGTPHSETRRFRLRVTPLRLVHYFLIAFVFVNIIIVTVQCFNSVGRTWGGFSFNYYFKISGITAAAQTAGLNINDQLVLINGQPVTEFERALGQKNRNGIGTFGRLPAEDIGSVSYTLLRTNPGSSIATQTIVRGPSLTFDLGDLLGFYGVGLVVGWVMFLIGVFIYFLKQDDRPSQVFMLAMINGAIVVITGYSGVYTYRVHPIDLQWFEGLYGFALALLAATVMQMAGNFPLLKPLIARFQPLQFILYPVSIVLGGIYIVQVQNKVGDIFARQVYDTRPSITPIIVGLVTTSILAFFAGIIRDWRYTIDPSVRRQCRIVLIGAVVGISPLLFGYAIPTYLFGTHPIDYNTGYAFLIAFPLMVAYAIVRYKLFDLNYLLRRSFAYVVSSAVVLGVYFFLVTAFQDLFTRLTGQNTVISIIISTVIIATLFQPIRDRLQRLVDRFFFRERFVFRQAMVDFGAQLRDIYDVKELSRRLVLDISAIMDLDDAALYLKPLGGLEAEPLRLSEAASKLERQMQGRRIAFRTESDLTATSPQQWAEIYMMPAELHQWLIDYNRPLNMAALPTEIPPAAAPTMAAAFRRGITLAIPLVSQGQMLGLLLLTRKRNGAGVLREDIDLLNSVVPAATLSIRNAQLLLAATEQERITRELEIAREIQQGLFPKHVPQPSGFRISAICLPAQETSGDFFDFVELADAKLGIIVADACGKSVPAAMMMSLARNTMRSEIGHFIEPAPALTQANKWLVQDLGDRRYVALTYLLLDVTARQLTLGNAGGLSPILRRDGQCRYLVPGGITLPLGIEPDLEYRQSSIELCPGDLVLAYTDGVVETADASGDLFSFERLEQLLVESDPAADAEALSRRILARLREFSDNAPQADDTTIVVLQVL